MPEKPTTESALSYWLETITGDSMEAQEAHAQRDWERVRSVLASLRSSIECAEWRLDDIAEEADAPHEI
jgi:hypothetical protein